MNEWICEEVPAVTIDGKVISTMLRQDQELVRCKDCKHSEQSKFSNRFCCELSFSYHEPDWFCADGKRK